MSQHKLHETDFLQNSLLQAINFARSKEVEIKETNKSFEHYCIFTAIP